MDNPHWIAGRIGGFRFGRIYRMAQAEADAVFGRAWVSGAVVAIAVVWTSAVLTEASKPTPDTRQSVQTSFGQEYMTQQRDNLAQLQTTIERIRQRREKEQTQ